jgi:hypothetical protein
VTVWVIRNGVLVERGSFAEAVADKRSIFPAPMLSRMEPYESPVTEKEITSWRERDRDMAAAGAVDPRDMPAPTRGRAAAQKREAEHGRRNADDTFKWHPTASSS